MPLNISTGNMYAFITHTYNTIKGECFHDCIYCYMKRWGKQNHVRFDKNELKTDLGFDNFIFVGSSNDMFSKNLPEEWIINTLIYCNKYDNSYLFQTKNVERILDLRGYLPQKTVICTTIETNRYYPDIMINSPKPDERADSGKNNLPEPSKEKTLKLISELKKFTKVHLKKNLNRIIK